MAPLFTAIQHAGLLVSDLERSVTFYQQVLGLTADPARPDLEYPGAWFQVGDQHLHLMQLPGSDKNSGDSGYGGRDQHIALTVTDIEQVKLRLDNANVPYSTSKGGRKAIFCRDPDGNALEFVQG